MQDLVVNISIMNNFPSISPLSNCNPTLIYTTISSNCTNCLSYIHSIKVHLSWKLPLDFRKRFSTFSVLTIKIDKLEAAAKTRAPQQWCGHGP